VEGSCGGMLANILEGWGGALTRAGQRSAQTATASRKKRGQREEHRPVGGQNHVEVDRVVAHVVARGGRRSRGQRAASRRRDRAMRGRHKPRRIQHLATRHTSARAGYRLNFAVPNDKCGTQRIWISVSQPQ
jgi:hypothetical protein